MTCPFLCVFYFRSHRLYLGEMKHGNNDVLRLQKLCPDYIFKGRNHLNTQLITKLPVQILLLLYNNRRRVVLVEADGRIQE